MQDCSFCEAFAEIVIIALRKSPADVWVEDGYCGERYASREGIRSCVCSHLKKFASAKRLQTIVYRVTYIDNSLASVCLL